MNTLDPSVLISGFLRSCDSGPHRPALEVGGRTVTYAELRTQASSLAATLLREQRQETSPPLTAVFAHRTSVAFAGILGSLIHGHGYVPLNRTFPPERTALMLNASGCRAIIVDSSSAEQLPLILERVERDLLILLPEESDITSWSSLSSRHIFVGRSSMEQTSVVPPVSVDPEASAYLLFTSGSTGVPKGVMVSHRNVRHFLDYIVNEYSITTNDRLSQTFDMTFDLSVFDMFAAWERGACVCCPSPQSLLRPDAFIRKSQLTIWFSVPSLAVLMKRLRLLKPGSYPSLRLVLFCGEPLPTQVAQAWGEAAPHAAIENLYGPTELTIACTRYPWDRQRSSADSEMGVVPIGWPFPGMEARIVGSDLRQVRPGEDGELIMTGPQLTPGYWQDPEKTARAYVVPPDEKRTFYRTGDRVRRPHARGPLTYLGRLDHQIKVRGHRVELGEVEAVLRAETGIEAVVAVGWPRNATGAEAIEAFVGASDLDVDAILTKIADRLPSYMVPQRIHLRSELPLNPNGKYDRGALLASLTREP